MRFKPRNTAMLKFCEAVKCWFFLALQCFVRFRPRNTVMLKKFQKIQNSGIYGQAGGRFLKILEFFEHYSVSCVSGLGKVDFFLSITVFCEVQATKRCYAQVLWP